jgi:hypothetical protein
VSSADNFLGGATIAVFVILAVATPVIIAVLVLVLVRMIIRRSGTGLPVAGTTPPPAR